MAWDIPNNLNDSVVKVIVINFVSVVIVSQTRYMEARHCLAAASVIATLAGEIPSEAAAKESEFLCGVHSCMLLDIVYFPALPLLY